MKKELKRRKSKDNPYFISSIGNQNIIKFKNNKKVYETFEISSEIYEAFNKFELEDISQLHEYERHIEHSMLCEGTLYRRIINSQPTVEDIIMQKIIYEDLYYSIKLLPKIQQRRIIMYYFKDMTLNKISQLEHCSIHSVFVSIERGKENLKKFLILGVKKYK